MSVISERVTASFHGHSIWFLAVHSVQNFSVLREPVLGIDRRRQRPVRQAVGQDEGHALARRDGEVADGLEVLAVQADRRAQHHHVGPGDGAQRVLVDAA